MKISINDKAVYELLLNIKITRTAKFLVPWDADKDYFFGVVEVCCQRIDPVCKISMHFLY